MQNGNQQYLEKGNRTTPDNQRSGEERSWGGILTGLEGGATYLTIVFIVCIPWRHVLPFRLEIVRQRRVLA